MEEHGLTVPAPPEPTHEETGGLSPRHVPPPLKPGRGQVRFGQVAAGFGLGLAIYAVCFGLFWCANALLEDFGRLSPYLGVPLLLLPHLAILGSILWAGKTGRKGLAIGLAIVPLFSMLLGLGFVLLLSMTSIC
jgi:hypothetical protein